MLEGCVAILVVTGADQCVAEVAGAIDVLLRERTGDLESLVDDLQEGEE